MRARTAGLLVLTAAMAITTLTTAKPMDTYVEEAAAHREAGDLDQAVSTMEAAIAEHPDSAIAYAYLGLYKGMQAGATDNFMEAGRLSTESFGLLDRAVEIDPDHPRARLYRGLMGVKVPEFLGKLPVAVEDLETVIDLHEKHPEKVSGELITTAYSLLGEGYAKQGSKDKAISAWEMVIALSPDTPEADMAAKEIAKLSPKPEKEQRQQAPARSIEELKQDVETNPEDTALLTELGKAYFDAGDYENAEATLREAIALGPEKPEAYKWLANTIGASISGGQIYDERIHEDTDWATKLAFEMVELLDQAVELAPDDIEARLYRGVIDIQMPFFTGKLDQGIEDLEMVMQGDAPDDMKAQAAFWLGYAHQKKGTTYWIKILTDYEDEEAAAMALEAMRPPIRKIDISEIEKPAVVVDFSLGFRDELPPQTAVWIETPEGDFVRTLYVSGFSGHAREVQIVLPVWAATSDFAGADAVTGASIDTGEHIYVWDLKDESGSPVEPSEYVVKVETHFWPSMKYEMLSAPVKVGGNKTQMVTQAGTFIPYLEVRYLP